MKNVLVLGASENTRRYSHNTVKLLLKKGYNPIAIGRKEGQIGETKICTEIEENEIDTVSVYVNPENQKSYYDQIVNLNPRRVIFNPGSENDEFVKILKANNIEHMYFCTSILLNTGNF